MRTITIRQLHEHTGKFVRQAQKEAVLVTDRGQQIAVLKGITAVEMVGKKFPKRKVSSLPKVDVDSTIYLSEERDAR